MTHFFGDELQPDDSPHTDGFYEDDTDWLYCPECGDSDYDVQHYFYDDDEQLTVGRLLKCASCGEFFNEWF